MNRVLFAVLAYVSLLLIIGFFAYQGLESLYKASQGLKRTYCEYPHSEDSSCH